MSSNALLLVLLLLTASVSAMLAEEIAHFAKLNYTLAPIEWIGSVSPGGPTISITGNSLEEIFNRFNITTPPYLSSYYLHMPVSSPDATSIINKNANLSVGYGSCQNCTDNPPAWQINCDNWPPAPIDRINERIKQLHGLSGFCRLPAKRVCTRVSCGHKAGVWWCNDSDQTQGVDCFVLGDWAQQIMNKCAKQDTGMVAGQQVRRDAFQYNIILGEAHC